MRPALILTCFFPVKSAAVQVLTKQGIAHQRLRLDVRKIGKLHDHLYRICKRQHTAISTVNCEACQIPKLAEARLATASTKRTPIRLQHCLKTG